MRVASRLKQDYYQLHYLYKAEEVLDRNKDLLANFARIAEDMGAVGIRVEKPADIGPAIARALTANRPVVIDVVTDIDALAPLAVS